jgi:hypothetical protein
MTAGAEIEAAIEATRRAGTAKVRYRLQPDGPTGTRPYGLTGAADLARCRVTLPSGGMVWDGAERYTVDDGQWRVIPAERGLGAIQKHPLWMLLDGMRWTAATDLGGAELDGDELRRLAARIEPARRSLRRRQANVEVWIDDACRIRLASIQIQPVAISGDPHLARSAERMLGPPENPVWNTTELVDFGAAVDLPEPPASLRRRRFATATDPARR